MAKTMDNISIDNPKLAALQETLKKIEKEYGAGTVMRLDEAPSLDIDVIPSGSIALDYALGIGGYPRGRIIEIYGPESSGKTTVSLHIIAEAQKLGGTAALAGFLSIIPLIYQRSKTNPALDGLVKKNEKGDK